MPREFEFVAELFEWEGNAAWHFVSIPTSVADEIDAVAESKRGFGSVPVRVTVGASTWETSVFPDKSRGTYLLPVKKAVRAAEKWDDGAAARIAIELRD